MSQLPKSRQSSVLPRMSRPKAPVNRRPLARPRAMRRPTRSTPSTPCTLSDLVYAIELDTALTRASALTGVMVPVRDKSMHLVQQQNQQQDLWARLECKRAKENALSNKTALDLHARWIQNHMERAKQYCSSSSSALMSRPQHCQRLMHSYA
ncbi:hypothetical protein BG005_010090 [Podila minutissima]|nr:hypothetical protein BG005_010090 [Podila minutissima]